MNVYQTVPLECFSQKLSVFSGLHQGVATDAFVANLLTKVETIEAGDIALPVTIGNGRKDNAWVCSPITTYGSYVLEESERLLPSILFPALHGIIAIADYWLHRAELDKSVIVNNWLVSTNLYPAVAGIDIGAIVEASLSRWPGHALWFRSLNAAQHSDWLVQLKAAGFELIPTRQVYLFRDIESKVGLHKNLKRDIKLLAATPLTAVSHEDFTEADFRISEDLYGQLYLRKYSMLNPQYTAGFLKAWHDASLLEFSGFRDGDGKLCAVVGVFGQGGVLTAPIVGYDTARPQSMGLYRLLMARVLQMARDRSSDVNLSAGAAGFKRVRGGQPAIEYSAVYFRHLSTTTRRTIAVLRQLTTRLGVPIMQRYKL